MNFTYLLLARFEKELCKFLCSSQVAGVCSRHFFSVSTCFVQDCGKR